MTTTEVDHGLARSLNPIRRFIHCGHVFHHTPTHAALAVPVASDHHVPNALVRDRALYAIFSLIASTEHLICVIECTVVICDLV